jgi:hypothetical protein
MGAFRLMSQNTMPIEIPKKRYKGKYKERWNNTTSILKYKSFFRKL